ncbi:MAG: polymer-forming cytoskeletal protein, partial [Syntrophomonadaceae bacterium]|nr:polymer-forming cytoskeletal protein [Syntrophomonadaceae bacterium]
MGTRILAALLLLVTVLGGGTALADENGTMVTIPVGEVRTGPTFLAGGSVDMRGTIDGDLFIAGSNLSVDGTVRGDVFAVGQNVRISGPVYGDIRVAAQTIAVAGPVSGSVAVAGQSFELTPAGTVGRDVLVGVAEARLGGKVARMVMGSAGSCLLSGSVAGDVKMYDVQDLSVADGAFIGGQLTYRSPQKAQVAPGATIRGQETWTPVTRPSPQPQPPAAAWRFDLPGLAFSLLGALVVYAAYRLLRPRGWQVLGEGIRRDFGPSLGWGLLLLVSVPLLVVLLMVTVIGLPLALVLGLGYVLSLYLAKIVVAQAMGDALRERTGSHLHDFWFFLLAL